MQFNPVVKEHSQVFVNLDYCAQQKSHMGDSGII